MEGLHEEAVECGGRLDHLSHFRSRCGSVDAGGEGGVVADDGLLAFALVGDVGLVDFEGFAIEDEELAPVLLGFGEEVGLLDADEEAALEVEQGVEVEEDVVHGVAGDDAFFFHEVFEGLQELEVLDVGPFGGDELGDDVLALGALQAFGGLFEVGGGGADVLDEAAVDEDVEDADDDFDDFGEAGGVVAVEVGDDEHFFLWEFEVGDAGLEEFEGGCFAALVFSHAGGEDQGLVRSEGVVEEHQRVASTEGPPEQRHGICVFVGVLLLFQQRLAAARHSMQSLAQRDADLEERTAGVGDAVHDVVHGGDVVAVAAATATASSIHRAHRTRITRQRRGREEGAVGGPLRGVAAAAARLRLDAVVGARVALRAHQLAAAVLARLGGEVGVCSGVGGGGGVAAHGRRLRALQQVRAPIRDFHHPRLTLELVRSRGRRGVGVVEVCGW